MRILEFFRSSAVRVALAFVLVTTVATTAVFGLVYFRIGEANEARNRIILETEAAKSVDRSVEELRGAFEVRLTNDLRRIDYAALFDSNRKAMFGNIDALPPIPVDGKAHYVAATHVPGSDNRIEPVIFVARQRPDGNIMVLGRSLLETLAFRRTVQSALLAGLAPMLLLALAIGAYFARRSSRRLTAIHDTIARIMKGDTDLRLPVGSRRDPIARISRDVNLMLDEIGRLLVQLKGVGDNIAHDLRSPLAVVHAQLERGLESSSDEQLRTVAKQALAHIDKAMLTVAALLRLADVEYSPTSRNFQSIDLSAICADLFEFYEPLAESKSIKMTLETKSPVQIQGDGDLMREAVSNLIGNAIKFTPENGSVGIAVFRENGLPVVRVRDSGIGVEPAERDKIFQRFYRTSSGHRVPGSGLGLSITAAIANLHELDLRFNDNNPGAVFEMVGRRR
ncbi:sensor histidine kinase [Bradyrhizobium erythrophlei]|jgi:signal transduction histidine kinase|uniref:histidine kinase n=1 Tax=Bradyrhizobium erythrophlei TaxID=1437360 RepID=A0A1M7TK37_9BRAD|nr:HAMP domain-containing sensor histidine kinase [Bradyrhizobium erythrophlei]SHN71080.1 Signal transduction histidine kinase [Bradyrhizobium erythrophlei]